MDVGGCIIKVNLNDYIVKGINGEFYKIEPEVFNKLYEEIKEK